MAITGRTAVYHIVGDPVAQVRAPELFNAVFAAGGVDAVVVPARVAPEDLEAFVRAVFRSPTVGGLFVAIPHKAPILRMAAHVSDAARIAGATNAVRRNGDGMLEADLFDGQGLVRAAGHFGIPVAGARVLIVGAGGGGTAIGTALAATGAAAVEFVDNQPGRAEAAAANLRTHFPVRAMAAAGPHPAGKTLVVNASPVGLRPGDPLPLDVAALDPGAALIDIIMTPQPTPLVQAARARGISAHPGYEMLVQQVPLYLRYFGHGQLAAQVEADLAPVRRMLVPGAP